MRLPRPVLTSLRKPHFNPHILKCISRRSITHFNIISHTTSCQHARHWRGGVEPGHESSLKLAVKQYIPKDNPKPTRGDVTFIGAAANGFPKVYFFSLNPHSSLQNLPFTTLLVL